GWAARILGFYAKTPVFAGASEREIGLLLKLAGLAWSREALALHAPAPKISFADVKTIVADLVPARDEDAFEKLELATLNDLSGRSMSQSTRDIFHQVRDFLAAAAKELSERETQELDHQIVFHGDEHEAQNASRKAEFKQGAKQLEKRKAMTAADRFEEEELPALSGMLGKKSDGDVDAAAQELMRLAGLTPWGKVWLRDGRSGEKFS